MMECGQDALRRAIKIIGSQTKLALKLKVSLPRLNHWMNLGIKIPIEYAIKIEILTEGVIPAEDLSVDSRHDLIAYKKFISKRGNV